MWLGDAAIRYGYHKSRQLYCSPVTSEATAVKYQRGSNGGEESVSLLDETVAAENNNNDDDDVTMDNDQDVTTLSTTDY